jgi:hypothetical protein
MEKATHATEVAMSRRIPSWMMLRLLIDGIAVRIFDTEHNSAGSPQKTP